MQLHLCPISAPQSSHITDPVPHSFCSTDFGGTMSMMEKCARVVCIALHTKLSPHSNSWVLSARSDPGKSIGHPQSSHVTDPASHSFCSTEFRETMSVTERRARVVCIALSYGTMSTKQFLRRYCAISEDFECPFRPGKIYRGTFLMSKCRMQEYHGVYSLGSCPISQRRRLGGRFCVELG